MSQNVNNGPKPDYISCKFFKMIMESPRFSLSQSHKITLKPNCKKGLTVVDQETAGKTAILFLIISL